MVQIKSLQSTSMANDAGHVHKPQCWQGRIPQMKAKAQAVQRGCSRLVTNTKGNKNATDTWARAIFWATPRVRRLQNFSFKVITKVGFWSLCDTTLICTNQLGGQNNAIFRNKSQALHKNAEVHEQANQQNC